jgi:hypothetical protein
VAGAVDVADVAGDHCLGSVVKRKHSSSLFNLQKKYNVAKLRSLSSVKNLYAIRNVR